VDEVSDGDESSSGPAPQAKAATADAAAKPVIELDRAISLIDRFPALAGIDLRVDEGEIVLLRGPNGAGKTTLLRLCAGLAPLNTGQGTVLGYDLADRPQRRLLRRHTGLLAHNTSLYDELTVEENMLFWAKANRIDTSSVEPVLDRLALSNRLRRVKVASLSAGQRRRTSLAVLVVRRPRLWLLDEPHAGLDVNGRDFVDGLVKHAVAFGATVMFASHDSDRATDIATRTVVIAGGQVLDANAAAQWGTNGGSRLGGMAKSQAASAKAAAGPRWTGRDRADAESAEST
jgi:heme ABC exporter ATP-binding subunit CcmA